MRRTQIATQAPKRDWLWLASVLMFLGGLIAAPSIAATTPPELLQSVEQLRAEIELIRRHVGKRPPRERTFRLEGANATQVYFQAQTLFRKCNRLAQQYAGASRQAPPPAPEQDADGDAVLQVINQSREQLALVFNVLDIEATNESQRLRRRADYSDVMHDIIEAGYVLNRLLNEPADWSEIYDRTLQMLAYVGGALPAAQRYPELPAYECCKQPQDVYAALLAAMEAARPLAEAQEISLIRVIAGKQAEAGASTSTVFDLTTTMLHDLAELTLRMDTEDVALPEYERPARIFPAHVLQLAQVLASQLEQVKGE